MSRQSHWKQAPDFHDKYGNAVLAKESLSALPEGHISSVSRSCLTLCDPMDYSMPGLPVHHQLPDLTQTHVH